MELAGPRSLSAFVQVLEQSVPECAPRLRPLRRRMFEHFLKGRQKPVRWGTVRILHRLQSFAKNPELASCLRFSRRQSKQLAFKFFFRDRLRQQCEHSTSSFPWLYPTSSEDAEQSIRRCFRGPSAMKQTHDFLPGDRITLLYPGVGANRHVGTVTQVTPASVFIQVDGLPRSKRFFPFRPGRWRSDLGHLVLVDRLSAERTSSASLKLPPITTDSL